MAKNKSRSLFAQKLNNFFLVADSGVESSATYAGHEGAASDNELPPSQSLDDGASPAPTLEDAMQRLAETIKEFDSHAMADQAKDIIPTRQQNMSQGQIFLGIYFLFGHLCFHIRIHEIMSERLRESVVANVALSTKVHFLLLSFQFRVRKRVQFFNQVCMERKLV